MGFSKVYRLLQEVFPQIDARLLRAVGFEHSKDADAAVETVLTEVVPFFNERSRANTPLTGGEFVCERSRPSAHLIGRESIGESSAGNNLQPADGSIVNSMGSTEDQKGCNIIAEGEESFHDAVDMHNEPIYDTYDRHHEWECVDAERDNVNTFKIEVPVTLETYESMTSGGWSPEYIPNQTLEALQVVHAEPIYDTYDRHHEGECIDADRDNVNNFKIEVPVALEIYESITSDGCTLNNIPGDIPCQTLEMQVLSAEPFYDTYDRHDGGVDADRDNENTFKIEVPVVLETYESITSGESTLSSIPGDIPCQTLETLQIVHAETSENLNLFQERVEYGDLETGLSTTVGKENGHKKFLADASHSVVSSASVTVDEQSLMAYEGSAQLVVLNDKHVSNTANLLDETVSQIECTSDAAATEDSNLNDSMSQAGQAHLIGVLEQFIGDARNNKKILFSAMQSVISLMRDVELKEETAEQAKVEAAMRGPDVLAKVEELKQMIQQAKEANCMLAGEVHGEKSILASELRELQSRALSLSEDRDKSLADLDEMYHALEARLDEAENEIKLGEQRKVEKEKAAMEALADEELIMEKVVQEAKMLKQQAEDNAKLQEFLVDRGQIVDMLQGEIAMICQDVRLMKDNLDKRVPFSKSLLSSQTGCINGEQVNLLKESDEHSIFSSSMLARCTKSVFESEKRDMFERLGLIEETVNDAASGLEEGWEVMDRNVSFT